MKFPNDNWMTPCLCAVSAVMLGLLGHWDLAPGLGILIGIVALADLLERHLDLSPKSSLKGQRRRS